MLREPKTLSSAEKRQFEEYRLSLRAEIKQLVTELLAEIPQELLRQNVKRIVFTPNDALPKRTRRPKWEPCCLVEQLADVFGIGGDLRDVLLQFTLCVSEYYDIFDDIADRDVTDGTEGQVFAAWQTMFPLCARLLHRLCDDAVPYWTDLASGLQEVLLSELQFEPTFERYQTVLQRQGDLFGALTGLSAVVAGESTEQIERAEQLGDSYFRFEQLLLDGKQYAEGEQEGWNAFALAENEEAIKLVRDYRETYESVLDRLSESSRFPLQALVSVDIDSWASNSLDV